MKKPNRQKTQTQIAIFAGAAALMTLAPQTHADTAVDALLNKLEQKGVLTVDEAKELKAENIKDTTDDFNKEFNSKFPMPDWITGYKFSGDLRGRFDDVSTETPFTAGHDNNMRLRLRLRAGLIVNMKDNMQVGFRLSTDDGSNPLSSNTTLAGNGAKKGLWVDTAYGKWTPINDGTWMVAGTLGKMDQPFQASPMVFDPDYTPEGAALQATYKINDQNSLAFNSAAFVLDQVNTRGPFLYGAQAIWNANWSPKLATSAGIAAYDIANKSSIAPGAKPYDGNLGNTLNAAGTAPLYNFNPVVASGSVTYTLDRFPLYPGAFPVKLAGEYMDNPGAASNNKGWWAGVTLGKSGKKGAWDISYRYQRLEADAWWDQVVNDDNVALFPTVPATAPETGSATGGTDIRGHLINFNYSIFDSLMFSFTCYLNDLIINPVPGTKTDALHATADLMWKF